MIDILNPFLVEVKQLFLFSVNKRFYTLFVSYNFFFLNEGLIYRTYYLYLLGSFCIILSIHCPTRSSSKSTFSKCSNRNDCNYRVPSAIFLFTPIRIFFVFIICIKSIHWGSHTSGLIVYRDDMRYMSFTLETSLICILLSASHDVHFDKRQKNDILLKCLLLKADHSQINKEKHVILRTQCFYVIFKSSLYVIL